MKSMVHELFRSPTPENDRMLQQIRPDSDAKSDIARSRITCNVTTSYSTRSQMFDTRTLRPSRGDLRVAVIVRRLSITSAFCGPRLNPRRICSNDYFAAMLLKSSTRSLSLGSAEAGAFWSVPTKNAKTGPAFVYVRSGCSPNTFVTWTICTSFRRRFAPKDV